MRVAEYEFFVQCVKYVGEGKFAFLFGDERVDNDVEENVAEFLLAVGGFVFHYRLREFVNFLDGEGAERLVGESRVPGTFFAQHLDSVEQTVERFVDAVGFHYVMLVSNFVWSESRA